MGCVIEIWQDFLWRKIVSNLAVGQLLRFRCASSSKNLGPGLEYGLIMSLYNWVPSKVRFWVKIISLRIYNCSKTDFWSNSIIPKILLEVKKVKIFHYITRLIMSWDIFILDQMGPFKIGGSIKAMFLLVGLLLDVFERLRIDWHKIGSDLRESLRSKYQIWLFQRQFLAIILSVLPT